MLQLKISKQEFYEKMKIVENAISDNKLRPVISGVYIQAYNGIILLKATNLEQTIFAKINGDIIEEGKIVFKHKLVEEFIKEIKEDILAITEKNGILKIETNNSESEFGLLDVEEYPELTMIDSSEVIEFNREELLLMLQKILIATGNEHNNPEVNCVRLEIENQHLSFVGTDKFRLLLIEKEIESLAENCNLKVSIPSDPASSLINILKSSSEDKVVLKNESGQIVFSMGDVLLSCRLIQLEYINYREIMSNYSYNKKVLIDKNEFANLLKRVIIFVRENIEAKYGAVFDFVDNKLHIRGIGANAKVKDEIDIQKEGEDIKISLNTKFLLDFTQIVETEEVEIELFSSESAIILKEPNGTNISYLTMPLALRES